MSSCETTLPQLPGKDCGLCGMKTCEAFAEIIAQDPGAVDRCVFVGKEATCQARPSGPTAR